jgi:hypothetical protein
MAAFSQHDRSCCADAAAATGDKNDAVVCHDFFF